MTTGDHDLDTQHKYLIEICNDLAKAIRRKRGPKLVGMVLDVLTYYANSHFKKEEECMARYRCLLAAQNQKAHTVFIEKLTDYRKEHSITDDPDGLALQIHQHLTEWVVNHIIHVDTHLHAAIRQNRGPNNGTQATA